MTHQQAVSKAKKRWGKAYYVRSGERLSSAKSRNDSRAQYQMARTEIESIEAEIKERLSQLDWYQELRNRQRALRKKSEATESMRCYYKFSVGKSNGMFTEIIGQGDTWEEAFAMADKKAADAA